MTIVDRLAEIQKEAAALLAENEALKKPPAPPPPPPPVEPVVKKAPAFGVGPFTVGASCERVVGEYTGTPVAGRRYRDDALIEGATGASYTIAPDDAGKKLVYEEQVDLDGKQVWFKSEAVVPASAPSTPAIDEIVADMRLPNDFPLAGYENRKDGWYIGSDNGMAATPVFNPTSTATWSIFYNHPQYWGKTCRAILPWAAIYDYVGDQSKNTAVELTDVVACVRNKAGQWIEVTRSVTMGGMNYAKPGKNLAEEKPTVYEGGRIIALPADRGRFWHGWGNKVAINPNDIAAIHVRLRARLVVVPGKADDRAKALIGLQVGNDYYIDAGFHFAGMPYAPSSHISRTRRITSEWQTFTATTIKDVGSQNPGKTGVSEAELRAMPPPL